MSTAGSLLCPTLVAGAVPHALRAADNITPPIKLIMIFVRNRLILLRAFNSTNRQDINDFDRLSHKMSANVSRRVAGRLLPTPTFTASFFSAEDSQNKKWHEVE